MTLPPFIAPEHIQMKKHPEINERWIEQLISTNPNLLGLGDLKLLQAQRRQPNGGVLDMLLEENRTRKRYEVEIQLGSTDPSHIIRTIEYWDSESRRSRDYDHCAVLVAEDITHRFLNVVTLLNRSIPLIALQMQAFRVGNNFTVTFTRLLDELTRSISQADTREAIAADQPTDRSSWVRKASLGSVEMADAILQILKRFDASLELKYNKRFIGIARSGRPDNFVLMRPRKTKFVLEPRSQQSEELEKKLAAARIQFTRGKRRYRIILGEGDIHKHQRVLERVLKAAFGTRNLRF